jgi:hypothetical protein
MLPPFFVLIKTGIEWDLFFTGIHPAVAIIVTLRAIGIKAWTLERHGSEPQDGKEPRGTTIFGTEMSD